LSGVNAKDSSGITYALVSPSPQNHFTFMRIALAKRIVGPGIRVIFSRKIDFKQQFETLKEEML
jgi:hypothetical protein